MIIVRNGYRFSFRECDTKGMTVEEVTKLACGRIVRSMMSGTITRNKRR